MADLFRAVAGAALLLGTAVVAGCAATGNIETAQDQLRESEQVRALTVQVETLKAKLAEEQKQASQANVRADLMQRELAEERELLRQQRETNRVALKLIEDQKAKLDGLHSEAEALKTLRQDVIRLNNMVKERDAELARLRGQLEQLTGRADGKTP